MPPKAARRTFGVERLIALSDGVFAIVCTLLVLDIKLPEPPHPGHTLARELWENVPDTVGWAISFVVLARLWVVHHRIVDNLARCRSVTIVLNFAFLAFVSLIPFAASLIGAYEFHNRTAVTVFSVIFGSAAISLGFLARHVQNEPLLAKPNRDDLSWHARHHTTVLPLVAAVAIVAGLLVPQFALFIWLGEGLFIILTSLRDHRPLGEEITDATLAAPDGYPSDAPTRSG
jgi:uncharacterized membrane protein